jgi:LTXXQ motif family protein
MTKIKSPDTHHNTKQISAALKIAASAGVISLMLVAAAGTAFAAKPGPGGGHPGGGGPHPGGGGPPHIGGGAPHFGGGAPHMAAPHMAAPHMAAPHFAAPHMAAHPAPHFAPHAAPHFAHGPSASHFAGHAQHFGRGGPAGHMAHMNHGVTHGVNSAIQHGIANHDIANHGIANHEINNPGHMNAGQHPLATTEHQQAQHTLPAAHQAAFHSDPRAFAAHRHQLADNAAFRPFWNHGWHRFHHLGWIGPVFWPYAYGDFFYYALWPDYYDDVDPVWAYGDGDIYAAMFSPYDYSEYVQGPSAPSRMATLTQSMAQSCSDEAAEVTGWPIDQIQAAVQPTQQQTALLDDLGNALVKASDEVKANCPTTIAFTPTGRLDQMQQRLQALVEAVNIVSSPLDKFYDSLSDEQKARFNGIAPSGQKPEAQNASTQNPQGQCNANVMNWPGDQIDRTVQPNDAQREKLQALQSASAQAADLIKAACPTEMPATPPARLAAVGKRLNAMLQAVGTVRPALADFYGSLSDDQKARFNTMGKQLFAENSR